MSTTPPFRGCLVWLASDAQLVMAGQVFEEAGEHRNAQEVTGSSPRSATTQGLANSSQRSSGRQSEDCVDAPSRSLDSAAHPLPPFLGEP